MKKSKKSFYAATNHMKKDRDFRYRFIKMHIGFGTDWYCAKVERCHINGPEYHYLTTTGIIRVCNAYDGRVITYLIARPGQILRYFGGDEKRVPSKVLEICRRHQELGYNIV